MNRYQYGCLAALQKLGMEAGPVPYVATTGRDTDYNANMKQDIWKSMDDETFTTGEESGQGMPSPSKTANENDGAYGTAQGTYDVGGFDANRLLVDRDKRISDANMLAFAANRDMDQSFGPEAAMTQPHGPKMAGLVNPLKIKSPMTNSIGMMGKRTSGLTPKPMGLATPGKNPMGSVMPKATTMPVTGTNMMNNLAGTAGPAAQPMGVDNAMTAASSHVGKLVT